MLQIVIDGVAAVIAGKLSVEEPLEITKCGLGPIEGIVRPRLTEQVADCPTHGLRRTDLHGVRDVEIAAPVLHFYVDVGATSYALSIGVYALTDNCPCRKSCQVDGAALRFSRSTPQDFSGKSR